MAGYADRLLSSQGNTVPPPPATGGYADRLLGDGSSMGAPSPENAAGLANNRFDAMLKSKTDTMASGASLATIAKASLPLDIQKKIKIFAAARGIPPEDYGVDHEGNIGYVDPNGGGFKLEVPTLDGGSWWHPLDKFMRLGAQASDLAGPLASQVAGGGAAVVAPPILKIPVAGAAAGVVDLGRQALGNYFAKSPLDDLSYWNAGGQAALAAGGELAGTAAIGGYNRLFGRNTLRAAGSDVAALRDPQNLAEWQQLSQEARRRGITLTPGNLTNVRSLVAAERQIGRQPEGQDALYEMTRLRNTEQVPDAVRAEIGQISPTGSPALGARQMQQGAEDTIDKLVADRSAAASPGYVAAKASGTPVDIAPVLSGINAQKAQVAVGSQSSAALSRVQSMLTRQQPVTTQTRVATQSPTGATIWRLQPKTITQTVPETDLGRLHSAKLNIDKMIERAQSGELAVDRETLRTLVEAKRGLTKTLVDTSPDYAKGRAAYIAKSPPVDVAKDGLVGLAARDRQFYAAVPDLLAKGDTVSIAAARTSYEQAGQIPAWHAGVRAYLENALRDAEKVTQAGAPNNVAGKFYQAVYGDQTLRGNLAAAFGAGPAGRARMQSFDRLAQVLEAAARSPAEGAPTATDLGARANLTGRGAAVTANVIEGVNPLNIPRRIANAVREFSQGRNAAALAHIYTNDDAMRELARLRLMPVGSQAATRLVANVLTRYGYIESPALDKPSLTPPVLGLPGPRF